MDALAAVHDASVQMVDTSMSGYISTGPAVLRLVSSGSSHFFSSSSVPSLRIAGVNFSATSANSHGN